MSKKISSHTPAKKNNIPFPIVAIGASAGGLQAVIELFEHLPPDTGMGYVYIQHLDPNIESKLTEILSKSTKMKVVEARHLAPVEPNHVYVIPANKDISILDGVLTLNTRKGKGFEHMPVDSFFSALAEKHNEGAIGIVLSGSGSDGTLGLKSIKNSGGITFAQDETAQFQSMPKSAIADGMVDMVLSPKAIAHELARLGKQKEIIRLAMQDTEEAKSRVDEDLIAIIHLLRKSTGVDFTHYKSNTIRRRIVRRMLLYKLESMKDYFLYMKQHITEVNSLFHDLLINVTSFFRDPDTMEYLKKVMIPRLLKSKSVNENLRIWVPACSTGEEAYSLAMIIMEALDDGSSNINVQIFATDLSEVTIAKARLGVYTRNEVANISPKRLQRFFIKIDGSYRIKKDIRDLCVFAPHNIFKDPPFSRIDLISCCNLMIYLDAVLQKKIMAIFHYALNPNGFLILGKSETIGTSLTLFSQLEKKFKVYARKKSASNGVIMDMNYGLPEIERIDSVRAPRSIQKSTDHGLELEKTVDNILLNKYVPASVVVNLEMEILQFRGSTGLYLEPSPGKASLNLLKMARPGLIFELRSIINKATKSGEPAKKTGLEIKINNTIHLISIEAVPLKSDTEEKLFLVIFEQMVLPEPTGLKSPHSRDKLVKQLEDELRAIREDMRSIIEEQEASKEELQSANEEIVSSNEELQSINEELETSKEELESSNEELMTINAELQIRNEQLAEAYEYAEAVFGTIREAILILDKNKRIKSANKSFYTTFQMTEDDCEGLIIYEMANRQWNFPKLREVLEDIIPMKGQVQDIEINHSFPNVGEKILLLNACRVVQKIHQQQLFFLAFEDITDLRRILNEQK